MKTLTTLIMLLAVTTAAARAQSDTAATAPITTAPIIGIDSTALAGSARASKVIGSKVYKGPAWTELVLMQITMIPPAEVTQLRLGVFKTI